MWDSTISTKIVTDPGVKKCHLRYKFGYSVGDFHACSSHVESSNIPVLLESLLLGPRQGRGRRKQGRWLGVVIRRKKKKVLFTPLEEEEEERRRELFVRSPKRGKNKFLKVMPTDFKRILIKLARRQWKSANKNFFVALFAI